MRRQRFDWSIAGCVYGLSSECLEVSASVNHSRFHLSCSICVRIWCIMQDLCCLSPYPPTLWCICVLKRILLPLSLECRSQACATLLDLWRSFCWRFPPVPFGSWSLNAAFHQPVVHPEAFYSFCLRQQSSLTITPLGALMGEMWISDSCLPPFPT